MSNQKRPRTLLWQQLYGKETVPIVAQRISSMNGDFEPHAHDFVEVVLILSGYGRHVSLNGERMLTTNDVIALRPGTWHVYRACEQLEVYNCCFSYDLLQSELAWASEEALLQKIFGLDGDYAQRQNLHFFRIAQHHFTTCLQHLDAISAAKQAQHMLQKATVLGHLFLFLAQIAQCMSENDALDESSTEAKYALPMIVQLAKTLLDEQLAHPWDLAALAERLGVDRSYLVRLFTTHTGISPMAYLARRRAEQAAHLLISTDLPIASIGASIGWPEPRHFARSFKGQIGVSASAYRARFFAPITQPDQTHRVIYQENEKR